MAKWEKFEFEGETYYYNGRDFVASNFLIVEGIEQKRKVAEQYFSQQNYNDYDCDELYEMIRQIRRADIPILCEKTCKFALEKYGDIDRFVDAVFAMYTSALRKNGKSQEAVDEFLKYRQQIYNNEAIFTSVGAAYCDLDDFANARKCADIANSISISKGHSASIELQSLYSKLKSLSPKN